MNDKTIPSNVLPFDKPVDLAGQYMGVLPAGYKENHEQETKYICRYKPDVVGDVEVHDYKGQIRLEFKRAKFVVFIDPKDKLYRILRAGDVK